MSQRLPNDSQASQASQHAAQAALELELVLAAKHGDRQAFGKLAQQYQRQCAAVALRLLGNTHDAMELVQDALLKAFRSLGQLQQSERFGPWLMRIVTNLALNQCTGGVFVPYGGPNPFTQFTPPWPAGADSGLDAVESLVVSGLEETQRLFN